MHRFIFNSFPAVVLLSISILLLGHSLTGHTQPGSDDTELDIELPFPDWGPTPPKSYLGENARLFELSQSYPTEMPDSPLPPMLEIDFTANNDASVPMEERGWYKYVMATRAYCFEGNIKPDPEDSFRNVGSNERPWYHIPWQHYGPAAREFVHGLTMEAFENPRQIAPQQTQMWSSYAIGYYNDRGGYQIGKVWRDHENPDPRNVRFPVGTVVFKFLFTTAPVSQIPYLDPPLAWNAYTYDGNNMKFDEDFPRHFQPVLLIQMDIAVRDPRAKETGWVFGTLVYNGAQGSENRWLNLVPLGLQTGNDPTVNPKEGEKYAVNATPTMTMVNPAIRESFINDDPKLMPPQHLGYGMRLAGPLDNPQSSCMSCHSTAESPQVTPILPVMSTPSPVMGSKEWMHWFQNVEAGYSLDTGTHSLDYSLQLAISVQNFFKWKSQDRGGHWRSEYVRGRTYFPRRDEYQPPD